MPLPLRLTMGHGGHLFSIGQPKCRNQSDIAGANAYVSDQTEFASCKVMAPAQRYGSQSGWNMFMLRKVFVLFTVAAMPVLVWLYGPYEARSVALQALKQDREDIDLAIDTVRAHLENIQALSKLELAHGPATDFWHSDASAEAERIERILAAERSARAALIEHFGPQIAAAPVFWRLFRPLHERMPQLTYPEQIRIHELEREFVARGLRSGSGPSFNEHLSWCRVVGSQFS
jgi:hypothetical protein